MAKLSGTKVALIVVGVVVLLVAGTCGGIFVWLQSHREELTAQAKAAMRDGARYGTNRVAGDCVEEALRRLPPTSTWGDPLAEATNKVWLESCLRIAALPPEACTGIPARNDLVKSAQWAIATCAALGKEGNQGCARLIGALQERCGAPR